MLIVHWTQHEFVFNKINCWSRTADHLCKLNTTLLVCPCCILVWLWGVVWNRPLLFIPWSHSDIQLESNTKFYSSSIADLRGNMLTLCAFWDWTRLNHFGCPQTLQNFWFNLLSKNETLAGLCSYAFLVVVVGVLYVRQRKCVQSCECLCVWMYIHLMTRTSCTVLTFRFDLWCLDEE